MLFLNDEYTQDDGQPVELTQVEEDTLYKLMETLGLIMTPEEAEIVENLLKIAEVDGEKTLEEARNIVKLNKQARLASLTTNTALTLARRANDPAYRKWEKAAIIRRQQREIIERKFGAKARTTARALLQNAGKKKNMVDARSTGVYNQED